MAQLKAVQALTAALHTHARAHTRARAHPRRTTRPVHRMEARRSPMRLRRSGECTGGARPACLWATGADPWDQGVEPRRAAAAVRVRGAHVHDVSDQDTQDRAAQVACGMATGAWRGVRHGDGRAAWRRARGVRHGDGRVYATCLGVAGTGSSSATSCCSRASRRARPRCRRVHSRSLIAAAHVTVRPVGEPMHLSSQA